MRSVQDLDSLLHHVITQRADSFYPILYKNRNYTPRAIATLHDWAHVPLMGKDDLIATPIAARILCEYTAIDHLRATSGTTGKPPLFCPRTPLRHMEYRFEYHDFAKPILAFGVPAMPHWHEAQQHEHNHPPRVIVFDPKYARASIRLAKAAGVDSISVFAFHMPRIGELIRSEGFGDQIKCIELCGEACTQTLFHYIREVFPNATIIPFYGSSEVEDSPIGMPCRAITGVEPLAVYHAKPSQYHEIIDPDTDMPLEPRPGVEGELILTSNPGEPCALPLIRFRTGDMVRVVDEHCDKHDTWSFTVLGRTTLDFLKILGGVVRADEIERVLRELHPRVTDRFELHRFDEATPQGPRTRLMMKIECAAHDDLTALASLIAARMRVSPTRTYHDGVSSGMYLPLTCERLEPLAVPRKHRRIIAH